MRKKVLWIEDSALDETSILATPVHLSGEFDLDVALSATEAAVKLCECDYEAVIVDIRIPPGEDKPWVDIYYGSNKDARLGLILLRAVLDRDRSIWHFHPSTQMRDCRRYGVLSVENKAEIGPELAELNVLYHDKATGGVNVLLDLIHAILKRTSEGENGSR